MPTEIKKEYLHLFETQSAHDAAHTRSSESYFEPWTAYTVANKSVSYNLPPYDYSQDYLTFRALEGGTFTLTIPSNVDTTCITSVSYSLDNGETWTTTENTSSAITITTPTVQTGDTVLWKGSGSAMGINSTNNKYSYFSSTGNYSASGNIMSLLYGDVFSGESALSVNYAFASLFKTNKLVDASNLALPATTLADSCYTYMFYGCTGLTAAPALPATTMMYGCYDAMFAGCTALTTAPVLPATTLAQYCYSNMFQGCTSLTTAPALPATTLVSQCYYHMFEGCTGLTAAPELPATTLASNCYGYMFKGCTSLTTAPSLNVTTLASYCYEGMFRDCTSLTTAPVLNATTLAPNCYSNMFQGCIALTTAPDLPATTMKNYCYSNMFNGCTALTTAPDLPATTLTSNCYYQMFYGCAKLNHIKAMFTTRPSTTYTNNWVKSVASTGRFIKNSSATWNVTGVNGVPSGWTVETASS